VDRWADVRAWWPGTIAAVPEELVGPQFTPETRAFLTTVGLPTSCPLTTLTFYRDERLRTPIVRGGRTYVAFGDDLGLVPFVVEAGRDEVYDLLPRTEARGRFVSSTVADFVYSLGLFCSRLPQLRAASDAELKVLVRRLRTQLTARDRQAMADRDHWWPRLLGQTLERFV